MRAIISDTVTSVTLTQPPLSHDDGFQTQDFLPVLLFTDHFHVSDSKYLQNLPRYHRYNLTRTQNVALSDIAGANVCNSRSPFPYQTSHDAPLPIASAYYAINRLSFPSNALGGAHISRSDYAVIYSLLLASSLKGNKPHQ